MNIASRGTFWIEDNEKYALIGLSAKVEEQIPFKRINSRLWIMADAPFRVPSDWREWLGTIRVEEIEDCNLFLLSKLQSKTPDILDGENEQLSRNVFNFYVGLVLASTFSPAHKPILLTGSQRNGEVGVRSQGELPALIPHHLLRYPPILGEDIELAAILAEQLFAFNSSPVANGRWRFSRTLTLYMEARTTADILEQIHQYCRCIDGLILSVAGEAKKQFKSRTELFIGPRYHQVMGEIYEVRSAVEHLHENRYLEKFDRETHLDLLKKAVSIEYVARKALVRIVGDRNLWPHFANTSALQAFWSLDPAERKKLWGEPVDPAVALADFDPRYIHDGILGG